MIENCTELHSNKSVSETTSLCRSTWIYSLPCQNELLCLDRHPIDVNVRDERFRCRSEDCGRLYYSRKRGPIFRESYVKKSGGGPKFQLSSPVRVDIELTSLCFLNCVHCYFGEKGETELKIDYVESLLTELAEIGTIGVQFIGGEPFLYSSIVRAVQMAKHLGLKVEIFTSGFGLNDSDIAKIRGTIDFLAIDIDGVEATHDNFRGKRGSYRAALNVLDAFAGSGTCIDVTMILNQMNIDEIEQVYDIAVAHRADTFNVRLFHPSGNGSLVPALSLLDGSVAAEVNSRIDALNAKGSLRVHPPFLFNCESGEFSFFGCPGGKFSITVKPTGDVVKCNVSKAFLGNILTTSFREIWCDIAKKETQRECTQVEGTPDTCGFSHVCGGPCEMTGFDEKYCFSLATK